MATVDQIEEYERNQRQKYDEVLASLRNANRKIQLQSNQIQQLVYAATAVLNNGMSADTRRMLIEAIGLAKEIE